MFFLLIPLFFTAPSYANDPNLRKMEPVARRQFVRHKQQELNLRVEATQKRLLEHLHCSGMLEAQRESSHGHRQGELVDSTTTALAVSYLTEKIEEYRYKSLTGNPNERLQSLPYSLTAEIFEADNPFHRASGRNSYVLLTISHKTENLAEVARIFGIHNGVHSRSSSQPGQEAIGNVFGIRTMIRLI